MWDPEVIALLAIALRNELWHSAGPRGGFYDPQVSCWIRISISMPALDAFLKRNAPLTFMSAVVIHKLRAGAVTDAAARALDRRIFAAFERRGRVLGPSVNVFKDCGRVLAALFRHDGIAFRERPRSLVNDILIAGTYRQNGMTLVTDDGDFRTTDHSCVDWLLRRLGRSDPASGVTHRVAGDQSR